MRIAPLLLVLCLSNITLADDYPQWMGPRRDGIHREQGMLTDFPKDGPALRWKAPVAGGYSGPAVAGGKVFVTDRILKPNTANPSDPFKRGSIPGSERIQCLNESDGKSLWTVEYDCDYTVSYAAGPRCTPAVDGDRVYTLGAEGHLYCIDIKSGKPVWHTKLAGPTAVWGFAGHPLIEGDNLIVLGSGTPALVLAFNKLDGKPAWSALEAKEPGYSPPMIHTIDGVRTLVIWNPKSLVGLDLSTGKSLWSIDHGPVRFGSSITPPYFDNKNSFVVTSEYEGAAMIKVTNNTPEKIWHVPPKGRQNLTLHSLMSPMHGIDGGIFGVSSDGPLRFINATDGKIVWNDSSPSTGNDEKIQWSTAFITPWQPDESKPPVHYFLANEKGDLMIGNISSKGYKQIARAHLLDPTNTDAKRPVIWCHPAYANKSIYWRSDKEIGCWSLAK